MFSEFERLTGWSIYDKVKESLIDGKLIRLPTTADKSSLDRFRTMISGARTEELKLCKFTYKVFMMLRLWDPLRCSILVLFQYAVKVLKQDLRNLFLLKID